MLDWDIAMEPPITRTPLQEPTALATPVRVRKMSPQSTIKCAWGPWERHEQARHTPTCEKCGYARNRRFWLKHTTLDNAFGLTTTWLCAKHVDTPDSDGGVGCKACAWAARRGKRAMDFRNMPYAMVAVKGTALKLGNFKRHALSATHKQNAKYYMHVHCGDGIGTPLFQATPGLNEFRQAWRTVRNVSGGAKSRNQCSWEWCLYEAWREQELEFMAKTETINITLDKRTGRRRIEYSASNREPDVRVGCLALMRDAGAASCEVTAAVHGAVTRFCTRGMRHPGMNNMRRNSDPSEEIQEHIRHKIEIFTTDGAANEQLAGKLLHPTSLRGDLKVTLPNMRWLSETKLARQGGPLNEHSIKTL